MTGKTTQHSHKALFLDRDGVINEERTADYVKSWEEFVFIPGVLEALAILSKIFPHLFIVTNQRGVGRGIMTEKALDTIHHKMLQAIKTHGGRIDKIYVCCDIKQDSINRKPNIGMALQAVRDFPDISLKDCLMVGNSLSDIQFGRNAGMSTVLIGNKYSKEDLISTPIDYCYKDLLSFALSADNFSI